ncbi:hypothetical protein [Nonomuraea sp. NPDC050643]|uniref:hypothetical protein n=1 Tax=Nonomuraea sp. NPDC050643 TaxID=3155660 RepID=UPI0033DFF77A
MVRRLKGAVMALATGAALVALPGVPADAAIVRTVCAWNVPAGWVKTDDTWDPTRCGNPTSIVYNVWTIESYYDKPIGWNMTVCAGWQPVGWAVTNTRWDPTRCGHPTSIVSNMWTIQRYF